MRTKRLMPAFALILATTGCASAVTSTTAVASAPAITSAPAASARGNTHITLYSVNSDGPRFQAIVTGAVGDHGQAVSVYPDGRTDPEHDSDLSLRLGRGSFLLSAAVLDKAVINAFRHWPGDPATCSGHTSVSAALAAAAVSALVAATVVVRRRDPLAAFAAVALLGTAQIVFGVHPGGGGPPVHALEPTMADLAIAVLLYTLAAYRPRRISLAA